MATKISYAVLQQCLLLQRGAVSCELNEQAELVLLHLVRALHARVCRGQLEGHLS